MRACVTWGLAIAWLVSGVVGCGAGRMHSFHAVQTRPAWAEHVGNVQIEPGDGVYEQNLASALAAALPPRLGATVTRSPYRDVLQLSLQRTVLGYTQPGTSPQAYGGPDGTLVSVGQQPRTTSVTYEVTLRAPWIRVPIRCVARDSGDEITLVEARVLAAVVRDLVRELTTPNERHELVVWEANEARIDATLRDALEHRTVGTCEAITQAARAQSGETRGRGLFAAARCHEALAIDASNRGALDVQRLELAVQLLEAARADWQDHVVEEVIAEVHALRQWARTEGRRVDASASRSLGQ